jgi:hypothetical protein
MTDDEKEILKTGAEAALKPFSNLMEKLFGGSVEQIGGMWEDSLRARRFERQIKLFARIQKLLDDAAVEPKEIPDKIWVPALQAASLEDEETLQEKWAALITNAATDGAQNDLLPSYAEILRQLSTPDIRILEATCNFSENTVFGKERTPKSIVDQAMNTELIFDRFSDLEEKDSLRRSDFPWRRLTMHAEHLQRLGLLRIRDVLRAPIVSLTSLGYDFVRTCRPPLKKDLEPTND